jgi:hypothetical protein
MVPKPGEGAEAPLVFVVVLPFRPLLPLRGVDRKRVQVRPPSEDHPEKSTCQARR